MVVDDSRLMRRVISQILSQSNQIQIIGEAANGKEALELIPQLNPDVLTLDINMPVMDGLTTLKHIMIKHPKPTVMLSTLTQEGADVTFDSLKYGAIDFIHKPSNQDPTSLEQQAQNLIKKVIMAAGVEMESIRYQKSKGKVESSDMPPDIECNYICAMGASEGGYNALLKIIPFLNPDLKAAFLIILYEDVKHVEAFANYLNKNSRIYVKRAKDGETLDGGVCYLASGSEYVTVYSFYGEYSIAVNASPFPTQKGSAINMLMTSMAEILKNKAMGVILTGSGEDGVDGLGEIIRAGGTAIIQDPKKCLYKEKPSLAIEKYKIDLILSDTKIADEINHRFAS